MVEDRAPHAVSADSVERRQSLPPIGHEFLAPSLAFSGTTKEVGWGTSSQPGDNLASAFADKGGRAGATVPSLVFGWSRTVIYCLTCFSLPELLIS